MCIRDRHRYGGYYDDEGIINSHHLIGAIKKHEAVVVLIARIIERGTVYGEGAVVDSIWVYHGLSRFGRSGNRTCDSGRWSD